MKNTRVEQFRNSVNYVKVNNDTISVYKVDNCSSGNPRYVVHFLALGLKEYKSTKKTRQAGLSIYKGKWFGGGFVFTSFNVESDLIRILDILHDQIK